MHADLKGALQQLNFSWKAFEHNGRKLSKQEVKTVLEHGIKKGYKSTADFEENEVDEILKYCKR